jgi:hypothetical protein
MSPELQALIAATLAQGKKEDTAVILIAVKDEKAIYVARNMNCDAKFLRWTLSKISDRLKGPMEEWELSQPS